MSPLPLLRYREALGPLCLGFSGDPEVLISAACADSRQAEPGCLFVAIRGSADDGTRYIPAALARGAVAVATEGPVPLPPGVAHLRVADAYWAAGRVAECAAGRPADRLRLLGVTGTNGKTTCAYLLRDMLRLAGRHPGMVGTVCYDCGDGLVPAERTTPTPFELQSLFGRMAQAGCDWVAIEVSSHALHQRRTGTARFAGALFTNLTGDHLDYHGTMEAYFEAKAVLFRDLLASGAPAVINVADPYGRRLHADVRQLGGACPIAFGAEGADVHWEDLRLSPTGSRFRLVLRGQRLDVASPLIGEHNAANIAGSAALAHACGVSVDAIGAAVAACRGAPGRLQAVPSAAGFTAYVDYAHTDDALQRVLLALRQLKPRRLLVVFGCGGDRDRSKRPRMGRVAAALADLLVVTSDNPRSEAPEAIIDDIVAGVPRGTALHREPDRRAAIRLAVGLARPGDLILIAGKGHETTQVSAGRTSPFCDAHEAEEAIADAARGLP